MMDRRDLLPVVEGSTVMTRYGAVKTDHILFIGAGAFHQARPTDLIPELHREREIPRSVMQLAMMSFGIGLMFFILVLE